MALKAKHKNIDFGVGDKIRVVQRLKEGEKIRLQPFEGIVIAIKGRENGKSFIVRRLGEQQIGIEKIFPLFSPTIEEIQIIKKGLRGVRRAKLYFIRKKTKKEVERIFSRVSKKKKAADNKQRSAAHGFDKKK